VLSLDEKFVKTELILRSLVIVDVVPTEEEVGGLSNAKVKNISVVIVIVVVLNFFFF